MRSKRVLGQPPLRVTDRRGELKYGALAIVAECQPCTPHELRRRLRSEFGASHGEAYRTIVELIHNGQLHRTMFGELVFPGSGRRSGGGYSLAVKLLIAVLMLGIVAFMAWGAFQMGPP